MQHLKLVILFIHSLLRYIEGKFFDLLFRFVIFFVYIFLGNPPWESHTRLLCSGTDCVHSLSSHCELPLSYLTLHAVLLWDVSLQHKETVYLPSRTVELDFVKFYYQNLSLILKEFQKRSAALCHK